MTKKLLVLLVLVVPLMADDKAELLKKAAELEKRATALLNDGKRQEAFDLLAKAAELRDRARGGDAGKDKRAKKAEAAAPPKKVEKPMATGKGQRNLKSLPAAVDDHFKRFDAALAANDMAGARKSAEATRRVLQRWADSLRKREQRLGKGGQARTLKRVEALERQVEDLRKLLTR